LEGDTGLLDRADRGSNPTTHVPLSANRKEKRLRVTPIFQFSARWTPNTL